MLHALPLSLTLIPSSKSHLIRNTDHKVLAPLLGPNIFLTTLFSNTLSQCSFPTFHMHTKQKKNYSCVYLVPIFLDSKLEYDSTPHCSKFNLLLISSWMLFWCGRFVPKYMNCSTLSQNLFPIFMLRFCPSAHLSLHNKVTRIQQNSNLQSEEKYNIFAA
jgi:hypothetical protein